MAFSLIPCISLVQIVLKIKKTQNYCAEGDMSKTGLGGPKAHLPRREIRKINKQLQAEENGSGKSLNNKEGAAKNPGAQK